MKDYVRQYHSEGSHFDHKACLFALSNSFLFVEKYIFFSFQWWIKPIDI